MDNRQSALILILIASTLLSCGGTSSGERAERAAAAQGDIVIGIVDTSVSPTHFVNGVRMAVSEINAEGLIGRRIRPLFYDDEGSLSQAQHVATKLAGNPDVVAVIGNRWSSIAIPTSITYNHHGILFISPGSTHPNLTRYGGEFTFRNIPTDEETGRQLAKRAHASKFRQIVIFYQRHPVARRLAEIFHEEAVRLEMKILSTRSFFRDQKDFRSMLATIKREFTPDCIFIAGGLPASAYLIRQARDMDLRMPILSGDNLDTLKLVTAAGRASNGTIVSTVFNPDLPRKATREFVKRFESRFGISPDTWAAQGYDAVRVLSAAIERSGSTVPIVMATTLKFMEDWPGVTGTYSFTSTGDITGKPIFFKKVVNGSFKYLPQKSDGKVSLLDYVEDFTLRLPVEGVIPTIDPGRTHDDISIEITEQLFLGLTDFDEETYEPVPELATDWTVSPDGMTYTFEMRDDVIWTDSTPVTAHDVAWAIRRNLKPETDSPYAYMLYILENAEALNTGAITDETTVGVRAVGNHTVEFRLVHPAAYFPAMAGLWVYRPLPKQAMAMFGEGWTEPENIICNGSYQLVAWEKGVVMILRRNPLYYQAERVSIPEVRYYVIPESSIGLAMYENNELDVMGGNYLRLPLSAVPRIKNNPMLHEAYSREPRFATYAYAFNTRRPPVDDPLVRRAISAAIDRDLLIQLITRGGEEPARTFTRPPIFGAVPPEDASRVGITFDPERARSWLAQAGYPNGEGFPEISLLFNASETHRPIAEAIQIGLEHYLNIHVELVEKGWDEYVRLMDLPDKPHLFRFGWVADYPDANNFLNEQFHPLRSANYIGWDHPEFAQLMNDAQSEADPEKRKSFYSRAEQILCRDAAAVVPIYFETSHCLVNQRVKGWHQMAMGGQHIRDWYFGER